MSTPSPYQGMSYKAPERITEEEKQIIKSAFQDERIFNVLKKVFIPQYSDETTPFEFTGADAFMIGKDWSQIPNEQVKSLVVARQETINWIGAGLALLKNWVNERPESEEERQQRINKNSTK